MEVKKLLDSFNNSIFGIINTLQTEKNMKFDFFIAFGVLLLSLFFDLTRIELLILFLSITLVFVTQLISTAIARVVNDFTDANSNVANISKNAAGGAVLVSAINAIIVGYILFFDRIKPMTSIIVYKVKKSPPHITFITILIVMLAVIAMKAYFGKGTPLKGGMPSGHSAIAFSLATIILILTKDTLSSTLGFIMALLVAQSRIESKIHSFVEITAGGILGILITVLIYQLF